MDFLEHPSVTDVVVPAIVLEEVRARNQAAFQRLKALTTSEAKRFYVFANENHKYACRDGGGGEELTCACVPEIARALVNHDQATSLGFTCPDRPCTHPPMLATQGHVYQAGPRRDAE